MNTVSKSRLIDAVGAWDAREVARILRERPELVSATDKVGRTLLHDCARRALSNAKAAASIRTARTLLAAGVPLDAVQAIEDDGEIFPATALWYGAQRELLHKHADA